MRKRAAGPPTPTPAAQLRFLVHVVPGLEEVTTAEVADVAPDAELVGAWKQFDERTSLLEYRDGGDVARWLSLTTIEDVFVLVARARGLHTDRAGLGELAAAVLSSKHVDRAMHAFAATRRGLPRTYRVVARKAGTHSYRRVDAQHAVERALHTRLPGLRLVDDDADVEFWLTIIGQVALVGARLSTGQMRGHTHTFASLPASLKPTIARAMIRLSNPRRGDTVLDPFCGAGTLLIERGRLAAYEALLGGDRDEAAVSRTRANAASAGIPLHARQWDALALPIPDQSVDVVITNPPFGKKIEIPGGDVRAFYRRFVAELDRVLKPQGRIVLITGQVDAFLHAVRRLSPPLVVCRRVPVLVRGERATIFVAERATMQGGQGGKRLARDDGARGLPSRTEDAGTPPRRLRT